MHRSTSAKSLTAYLLHHGLNDTDFWLSELEKVGVKSITSLKHLEGQFDTFSQLMEKVKLDAEVIALLKILKIDIISQKDKERLVQENRQKSVKYLQVFDDYKIVKSRSKCKQYLKERKKQLQMSQSEKISDSKVLQTTSGRRALQGIFLTKIINDQIEDKQCLLEVPSEVKLTRAVFDDTIMKQFSSSHEEHLFKEAIEILGHSITATSSVPVYGSATINFNGSKSKKTVHDGTYQQNQHTRYSSTVKSSIMQVASYSFKSSNLKLSQDACYELRKLLSIVKIHGAASLNAQEKCNHFFTLFGSHVNLGPLAFGGYFLWTCSSGGFHETQRETVKVMQKKAVSTNAGVKFIGSGVSIEVNFDEIKDAFKGISIECPVGTTRLEVEINGGPPEAIDVEEWRKRLIADNSTWVLTDRGKRLISVWDIIKTNYETEFGELIDVLRSSWEKVTGLIAEKDHFYNSECFLPEISEYNEETEELTSKQTMDKHKYISIVKKDAEGKPGSPMHWIKDISKSSDRFHPKNPQRQLNEAEENIVDLSSLLEFLKMKILAVTMSYSQVSHNALARDIETGIRHFRLHYYKTYEDILITILSFPLQCNKTNMIQFKPLSLLNLVQLQENFSKETEKFEKYKQNILHLQCYLLLLAIEQSHMKFFNRLMKNISLMMNDLQLPIDQQLVLELKRHLHHPSLITKFKPMLESLMKSSHCVYVKESSVSTKENAQSLKDLLQQISTNQCLSDTEKQFLLCEKNPEVHSLLDKLGLVNCYPKKLGLNDALCINEEILKLSLSGNSPTDLKQLPYLILHKIMSYDSSFLSYMMPKIRIPLMIEITILIQLVILMMFI